MNGLHLSYCVGAIVSPLVIAAFLHYHTSVRAAFWLLAALAAAAGFITLRLTQSGSASQKETAVLRCSPLLIVFFSAVLLFSGGAESCFSGWIYSYALHTGLAKEGLAGVLTSAFWGAMTFGRLVGVYLVRRLGSRRLLFISCAGTVFSLSALVFFPPTLAGLWISTLLTGLFQASIIPVTYTLAGERRIVSGSVAGIFVAVSSFGGMVFPSLAGHLMQTAGLSSFPAFTAATQVFIFISVLGILGMTRRKQ
jgi:fucose permease